MANLKRIFVIHTTANEQDAETDADFELRVVTPEEDFIAPFPGLPHNERERGRTDEYIFDVNGKGLNTSDPNFQIKMKMINTEDGWLPRRIWVLGETIDNQIIVLGSHPQWGKGFFDRGSNAVGPAEHVISG